MPRIINVASSDNDSLGNTFAKMADAIYGDGAKNEVYRQKALETKRGNDNAEPFAQAVRDGNRNDIGYYGALGNHTGSDAAAFNQLATSNHASSVDDPRMALATMGAGGAFSSTAPGQGRQLATESSIAAGHDSTSRANNADTNANNITTTGMNNDTSLKVGVGNNAASVAVGSGNNQASRDVATIQADKQAASDKYKFDNTYENTFDPDSGRTVLTPRSQAAGREVAPTKDSVVGNMLRRRADDQSASSGANDPFSTMSPRWQKIAGVDLPEQSLVHPASGQTGISRDGGQTVILPSGLQVPATGFQPVDQTTALNEARGGVQRAQTAQPLTVGDPTKSQAAADAGNTSGIGAKVAKIANEEIGALPGGPAVIKAVTGSPEISPATQRAQSQQDIRNNQARAVLLGGPGRQTVQAQKWVNELIPQGDALANPATEAAKIPTIVNALKGDHEQYRQVVQTTNDPAERTKALLAMHQIENTIRMYTEPQQQAAGAPAAAPPISGPQGPAQGPTQTATNPKTGQKIGLVNGQWVPM